MPKLEPKFILEKPSSDIETYIMAAVRYDYKRIKISTGDKILPLNWDSNNQRPTNDRKQLRSAPELLIKKLKYISLHLDEIELFINNLVLDLKKDKAISLDTIKDELVKYLGRKKEEIIEPAKIIPFWDEIIARMESGTFLTDKGTLYTPGTIKMYKVCRNQINEFAEEWGELTFESISLEFYTKFIVFCNSKQYKKNTIGRAIRSLKFIMNVAYKEKLHTNDIFKDKDFRSLSAEADNIYLTLDELKALYELDLSGNEQQEKIRDLFLIGCYTAQRFSDYSRYKPEHIQTTPNGTKVINIVTQKTKKRVIIPFLFPELDVLLKKYNYQSPKTYEQDLNEQIKIIGKKAGITQNVIINEMIGGKMQETIKPKYELIKTHTARRTGATNMFKMGYAPLEIMKVTGHTSESNFMKYIKISVEENAELMTHKIKNSKPQ